MKNKTVFPLPHHSRGQIIKNYIVVLLIILWIIFIYKLIIFDYRLLFQRSFANTYVNEFLYGMLREPHKIIYITLQNWLD